MLSGWLDFRKAPRARIKVKLAFGVMEENLRTRIKENDTVGHDNSNVLTNLDLHDEGTSNLLKNQVMILPLQTLQIGMVILTLPLI